MNTWIQDLSSFFRRYVYVILVALVIGNLIAWKNLGSSEGYFQYVIKIRTRVDYYDLVRSNLEKTAALVLAGEAGKLKAVPVESYRNENFYFIEMKLQFSDTSGAAGILSRTVRFLHDDPALKEKYFDLIENYDRLLATCRGLMRDAGNSVDPGAGDAAMRKSLFDLKLKEEGIIRHKIKTEEKIQVFFPSPGEMQIKGKSSPFSVFLTASALFFIIGLFAAVVIDRFRN